MTSFGDLRMILGLDIKITCNGFDENCKIPSIRRIFAKDGVRLSSHYRKICNIGLLMERGSTALGFLLFRPNPTCVSTLFDMGASCPTPHPPKCSSILCTNALK